MQGDADGLQKDKKGLAYNYNVMLDKLSINEWFDTLTVPDHSAVDNRSSAEKKDARTTKTEK